MRRAAVPPSVAAWLPPALSSAPRNLFLSDARLVFAMLNHLRYQALNRTLGLTREQANVLTAVVLLSAADGAYEATRRITRMRPHVSGTDAPSARSRCARVAQYGRAAEQGGEAAEVAIDRAVAGDGSAR